MKQFLKFTLATIVGIMITSFIGFLIMLGMIGAIASSSSKTVKIQPNSVYELELKGELLERSQDDPFEGIFAQMSGQEALGSIGLDDVLNNIRKAKNDENIKGIYLKNGMLIGGYASLKEIRDALADFKESGKFIVAYADSYTQSNYYLASVADKIYINPEGMLEFQGIAASTTFYKNTLDKIGVEMQVVKVGTFKSAVEPYIQTQMSDANREQVTVYINSIWNSLLDAISQSRNLSKETLNAYADEAMTFQETKKLVEYKLVDSTMYADGIKEVLKELIGVEDFKKINLVSHKDFTNVPENIKMQKDKVAVIYAYGAIDMPMMSSSGSGIDSEELVETINEVAEDKSVKAVVFRVNSPGGSAYGSEQIWHALEILKKEKPLIVSMGDYAASGGYYISCNADSILAQPNTITGSIGIFGTIPNVAGLHKKIGLTHDGVKTNKMSDMMTGYRRAFTPEERNLLQAHINRGYELFTKRCADGRSMQIDSLKAVAEGRVWTGVDALKLGLVDKLGGLDDAVKIAAAKANLSNYRVKDYPEKEDFMTRLLKDMNSEVEAKFMKSKLGNENFLILKQIEQAKSMNGAFALMPYQISLN